MYSISQGPSKILQKTRRGLTTIEGVDGGDPNLQEMATAAAAAAAIASNGKSKKEKRNSGGGNKGENNNNNKPIFFNHNSGSSLKRSHKHHHHHGDHQSQQQLNPHQIEVVKYVHEKWTSVKGDMDNVTYYQENEPNPSLRDFEPFDLEGWWGKKLYYNLTQGGNHNN